MALLNIKIKPVNLVPVNGTYTFTVQFLNAQGNLIDDSRLPQNQVITTSILTNPFYLEVEMEDGDYVIPNVTAKVIYGDKNWTKTIGNITVDCEGNCSAFPIASVISATPTSQNVTLSSATTGVYAWKILKEAVVVASGTVNVTTTSFVLLTPSLANANYLLELRGSSCSGVDTKAFTVNHTANNCNRGPSVTNVISASTTSLQFGFDGDGIFSIKWRIKKGSVLVREGITYYVTGAPSGSQTYNNSTPTITYPAIDADNYTLEIEGNNCVSTVSTKAFSLSLDSPLAFAAGKPSVTGTTNNYTLSIGINKTGVYPTTVLNSTTGTYYKNNESISYSSGQSITVANLPVGQYIIKVGTLESNIEIKNPSTGGPCQLGPTISALQEITDTSIKFLFSGQNVTAIAWRVKQGSTILRSGTVYPTNNTPFAVFNQIPVGNYSFEIEGANCTSSVSVANFEIKSVVTPPLTAGVANGKRTVQVGEYFYDIVNSEFAIWDVLPNGNVRITMPTTQKTFDGSSNVSPIILGNFFEDIGYDNPAQLAALKSNEGADLPEFTQLTALGYPARPEWGTSLKQLDDTQNRVWYSFGKNALDHPQDDPNTLFSHNSGQPHRATIYKYKAQY